MEFKTTIPPHNALFPLTHDHKIMLIGSCFSQEIGNKLNQCGFNTTINPFGTLFNPHSLVACLNHIIRNKKFTSADFFEHNGFWHSYKLHSSFSGQHLNDCIANVNRSISEGHTFLSTADTLIITFGSAWIYQLIENDTIVANCHKVPQQLFSKRKLGVNEVVAETSHLIEHLKGANPNLNIIFTISPVKHLKDGFIENNWSKSTLNVAVHELVRRFDFCDYYPAFEILNDDLRDYRFYKNDMVHPNELAVQYVFEHFCKAYFNEETMEIAHAFFALSKSVDHKTFNSDHPDHQKFISSFEKKANRLMNVNQQKVLDLLQKIKA